VNIFEGWMREKEREAERVRLREFVVNRCQEEIDWQETCKD